jgi:hypothetical protein
MKRFLMTIALTTVLSVAALAGEMPTCGGASPAPAGTALAGEMPGVGAPAPGGIALPGDMPGVGLSVLLTIHELAF